jgi:hypothetical protein
MESNSGFLNSWYGYGRVANTYNSETGAAASKTSSAKSAMVLSNKLNRSSKISAKIAQNGFVNDNVGEKYHQTHMNNMNRLISFSSTKLTVTLGQLTFIPISVLDIVMFKQPAVNSNLESSEYESGLYVVTKVARTIQNGSVLTTVQLCREGFNSQKGSLR